ncbi:MAG: imidazole glycerol phosphate synthase subunit HisH [Acidithiobacillales bacterium SM23_46]|jgi:glutamine amidotransferase|nr:MAG: imidazole glycerol phosphate synthase subunit HisH [Acidithiobacillales bacterium SM23_46]KPL28594.1 MAG: imidazole glycerol phosphate synthase subunit HisH [Acidithiobacillales bacterium SM1_46]
MTTIAVIDYDMGNLRSVCKALEHVAPQLRVVLTHDANELRRASRVVFPGQGAIGGCVAALREKGLREVLLEALETKPFLGICLGLQALYAWSEEGGGVAGFDILPGQVKRFPVDKMVDPVSRRALKVPHMGWNQVHQTRPHPIWDGIPQDTRFYFVHSYYAASTDPTWIAGTTDYGLTFTSAAARANIFAVQFHPEKSQHAGLQLLRNFTTWDGTVQ